MKNLVLLVENSLMNYFENYTLSKNGNEIKLRQNCEKDIVESWLPCYERTTIPSISEQQSTTKVIVPARNSDSIRFKLAVPKSRFLSDLKWVVETHSSTKTILPNSVEVEVTLYWNKLS